MHWTKKSDEIWNIIKKYHITEYGFHYPVIRCTIDLKIGLTGEIQVMRGSKEDCFVQKTLISSDKVESLIKELKPILGLNEIDSVKLRAAPDEIPHVEASYYLR